MYIPGKKLVPKIHSNGVQKKHRQKLTNNVIKRRYINEVVAESYIRYIKMWYKISA